MVAGRLAPPSTPWWLSAAEGFYLLRRKQNPNASHGGAVRQSLGKLQRGRRFSAETAPLAIPGHDGRAFLARRRSVPAGPSM